MIRMGRNNTNMKPELSQQPEALNSDVQKSSLQYNFTPSQHEPPPLRMTNGGGDIPSNSNRAFTDSEGITRDIKEGRLSGFIGSGTSLTGETEFKSMLRVDGHLVGKITSDTGTLYVGSGGLVDANISVAATIIHGTVNGDIVALENIELGRTAKVVGNIQTPSLVMEQGAILEGNCNMIKAKSDFEKRPAQNPIETPSQKNEMISPTKIEAETVRSENRTVLSAT